MSDIPKNPPGLVKREFFPVDMGRVVMNETWDISVPGCPMIQSPWHPQTSHNLWVRQVTMTREEFEQHFPPF